MQQIYDKIAELVNEKKEFVIATVVNAESSTSGKVGFKIIIDSDGNTYGTIGGGLLEKDVIDLSKELFINHNSLLKTYVLKENNESSLGMVCGGSIQVYMEYVGKKPQIVIFGAGHIGKKIYDILRAENMFDIIICDDRSEFADKEYFSMSTVLNKNYEESIQKLPIFNGAYIVIVTSGGKDDPVILKSLYDKNITYSYIGMIGSINRREKCFAKARELGVSDEFLNSIFSPIGLSIGAETPFEIAISILGEIIACKKGVLKNLKTEKKAHQ